MADYGHEIEFGYFLPDARDPHGVLQTARLADRLGWGSGLLRGAHRLGAQTPDAAARVRAHGDRRRSRDACGGDRGSPHGSSDEPLRDAVIRDLLPNGKQEERR